MVNETIILIAEDDAGHFDLVKRNLWRSCEPKEILRFKDGQEILDFLFDSGGPGLMPNTCYVLLLDIRMPKISGKEVLKRIKSDGQLKVMPVVMLTTTDERAEIENCYQLGCNVYITKPADYNEFMDTVQGLGNFLSMGGIKVPVLSRGSVVRQAAGTA